MIGLLSYLARAALGTGFTFLMTSLGAATVFFFRASLRPELRRALLGFAAGVMTAAAVWSLLLPAIEQSAGGSLPVWLPAAAGITLGVVFLAALDSLIPRLEGKRKHISAVHKQDLLLITAITLHNIPEGMAVGLAFVLASDADSMAAAAALAIGIGIQNFPEGAAVSLPLRREGYSRGRSFLVGQASGIVEPIAGVIGAATVVYITSILPYALSFAAGAMILVAVHELIPECQQDRSVHPYFATMGIVSGFAVMMLLDVMLG